MDYGFMSNNPERNIFNKLKYKSATTFLAAALNATIAMALPISDSVRDNFGPFVRFYIENRNTTIIIQVDIEGNPLGDNTISNSKRTIYLQPLSFLLIEPADGIAFSMVSLKNTHAANNLATTDVAYDIANY